MIDPREALSSGLSSLRHHALRSFLAMLGIIFGVGAVIAMLSIGAGAERQALEIIDAMGLRNVVVKDKRFDRENELQEIRRKSAGLSTRDAQAIRDAVPGVERVVAKIEVEAWKVLSPGGRSKPRVLGVSSDYPALVKLTLREGRFFDRTDEDTHAAVCVIGDRVRRDLFGFEPALGRPLKVNDQWLTVVGVLEGGGAKREIQGVTLEGKKAIEDVACYLVKSPLWLKRVYLDGQKAVVYRSRVNPSLGRNFEAMDPVEWLARMIPVFACLTISPISGVVSRRRSPSSTRAAPCGCGRASPALRAMALGGQAT